MKKPDDDAVREIDKLREHYTFDYSRAKPNRFANRFSGEATMVVLDPDVAAVFNTSEAVNQALRVLITALGTLADTPELLNKVKDTTTGMVSSQS